MGSIIERVRKDGGLSYQAMVKVPGGKALVKTFAERELAQAFVEEVEEQREKVAIAMAAKRKPLAVKDWAQVERAAQESWLNAKLVETIKERAKKGHMPKRDLACINSVARFVGDIRMGELDRNWVEGYVSRVRSAKTRHGRPYAWATIVDHMKLIRSTMSWKAEELGARGADLPFSAKKHLPAGWDVERDRRLHPGEERRIIARFMRNPIIDRRRQWLRLFRLALNTAARMQELHLSEWSEFNLDGRFWTIPAAHTKKKKTRVVPLNKAAIRALRAMWLIRDPNSPKVFHAFDGTADISGCFYALMKAMEIDDLRFHDLRHEAISRMVLFERHLRVSDIMAIVGHSSLKMLERYSNLRGDELASKLVR